MAGDCVSCLLLELADAVGGDAALSRLCGVLQVRRLACRPVWAAGCRAFKLCVGTAAACQPASQLGMDVSAQPLPLCVLLCCCCGGVCLCVWLQARVVWRAWCWSPVAGRQPLQQVRPAVGETLSLSGSTCLEQPCCAPPSAAAEGI